MSHINYKVSGETPDMLKNPVYLLESHCLYITNQLKDYLMGKFLTIIDTAISEDRQNKAVKDLVRQVIWDKECITDDFGTLVIQFIENYCPEQKENLEKLGWSLNDTPHPNFFGNK